MGTPKYLQSLIRLAFFLSFLGIGLFLLGSGGNVLRYLATIRFEDQLLDFNPSSRFAGAFQNYLKYSLDLTAFGSVLFLSAPSALKQQNPLKLVSTLVFNKRFLFIGLPGLAISISYFLIATTLGFRFRAAVLAISVLLSFILINRRIPGKLTLGVLLSFLLLYASLVGIGRKYGKGIQADRFRDLDQAGIIAGIFQESRVFHISGAAISFRTMSIIALVWLL